MLAARGWRTDGAGDARRWRAHAGRTTLKAMLISLSLKAQGERRRGASKTPLENDVEFLLGHSGPPSLEELINDSFFFFEASSLLQ